MKLNLNLTDISLLSENSDRPQTHHFVSNRAALRKGLDRGVVQNCLNSLDVFRDLLEGIPQQKNRVVRDVCKNIQLKHYSCGDVIYDVGEQAQHIFFCLTGTASICILKQVPKETQQVQHTHTSGFNASKAESFKNQHPIPQQNLQQVQMEIIEDEIQVIQSGKGFGEAQFIAGTKRKLRAVAKQNKTLIGKLQIDHFAEVIENYRQRVYYKKRDMFMNCSLFQHLSQQKLEFIINNTKPMTMTISQKLVKEGSPVDLIYLVNKGQISLWKTGIQLQQQQSSDQEEKLLTMPIKQRKIREREKLFQRLNKGDRSYSEKKKKDSELEDTRILHKLSKSLSQGSPRRELPSLLKYKKQKFPPVPMETDNKVFMGLMSEGCFIGDMEFVLGKPFQFNAVCKTEKAELYYCDRRIILSQMTEKDLSEARNYYTLKQAYLNDKVGKYKCAKQNIEKKRQRDMLPALTKKQLQMKRKIMHRHVEDKPSLIGHCSPRDIQKMLKRKQQRVIKQPQMSKSPILQLFPNFSIKKKIHTPRSFSPLAIVHTQCKGTLRTQPSTQQTLLNSPSSLNPESKLSDSGSLNLRSMIIKIKNWEPDLKGIKRQRQRNLLKVQKILGRYQECNSRLKAMAEVISKIQNNRI